MRGTVSSLKEKQKNNLIFPKQFCIPFIKKRFQLLRYFLHKFIQNINQNRMHVPTISTTQEYELLIKVDIQLYPKSATASRWIHENFRNNLNKKSITMISDVLYVHYNIKKPTPYHISQIRHHSVGLFTIIIFQYFSFQK